MPYKSRTDERAELIAELRRLAAAHYLAPHVGRYTSVRRPVFAHIGQPTITAIDAGHLPPFGEFGADGLVYTLSMGGRSCD
jgi:hypothetical protein